MGFKIVSPPVQPLIPAETVRLHLKIDSDHPDDALWPLWLASACRYAQEYTGRPVGNQTVELALDEFPCGAIKLPLSPVVSIASVGYIDANGDSLTLPETAYALDQYTDPNWLAPAFGTGWPETLAVMNAVTVTYVVGYGGTLPADLQIALLLMLGHYDRNRTAVAAAKLEALPLGVQAHLDNIRQYDLG